MYSRKQLLLTRAVDIRLSPYNALFWFCVSDPNKSDFPKVAKMAIFHTMNRSFHDCYMDNLAKILYLSCVHNVKQSFVVVLMHHLGPYVRNRTNARAKLNACIFSPDRGYGSFGFCHLLLTNPDTNVTIVSCLWVVILHHLDCAFSKNVTDLWKQGLLYNDIFKRDVTTCWKTRLMFRRSQRHFHGNWSCLLVSILSSKHHMFCWHTSYVSEINTHWIRSHDATHVPVSSQNRVRFQFLLSHFAYWLLFNFATCLRSLTYFSWSSRPRFFSKLFVWGTQVLFQIDIFETFEAWTDELFRVSARALVSCGT